MSRKARWIGESLIWPLAPAPCARSVTASRHMEAMKEDIARWRARRSIGTGGARASRPVTVPESVSSIAASYQDLSTARIRLEDGCYWYTHRGPVETTELPLRTDNGSPICTRPAS